MSPAGGRTTPDKPRRRRGHLRPSAPVTCIPAACARVVTSPVGERTALGRPSRRPAPSSPWMPATSTTAACAPTGRIPAGGTARTRKESPHQVPSSRSASGRSTPAAWGPTMSWAAGAMTTDGPRRRQNRNRPAIATITDSEAVRADCLAFGRNLAPERPTAWSESNSATSVLDVGPSRDSARPSPAGRADWPTMSAVAGAATSAERCPA